MLSEDSETEDVVDKEESDLMRIFVESARGDMVDTVERWLY